MRPTIEDIAQFITGRAEDELAKANRESNNADLGFNIFGMVSDIYHRENFHSDVLRHIIDTNGKHGEGNEFLLAFIQLLNNAGRVQIPLAFYEQHTDVTREKGRRDITIYGEERHVIIIENKINDAGDTYNQLPNYIEDLKKQEYIVDAVVYLTLNQNKEPDEDNWHIPEEDKDEIRKKLISIRAYYDGQHDLCWWLQECIRRTNNENNRSILHQYYLLIKHLTRNHMDHDFYDKLSKYLQTNSAFEGVAIGISKTMAQYHYHVLSKVRSYYKHGKKYLPFNDIREYTPRVFFLYNYNVAGYSFNSDIIIHDLEHCTVDFSVRHEGDFQQAQPKKVLEIIGMEAEFDWDGDDNHQGRYVYRIKGSFAGFEKNIISFIDRFLDNLQKNHTKIEAGLLSLK